MHPLIEKILKKRNIADVNELSTDEKTTFDKWQKTLTEKEVTVDSLQKFIEEQKVLLWQKLDEENMKSDKDRSDRKCLYLRARINNYESLLGIIKTPQVEKESLENYLKQLIK